MFNFSVMFESFQDVKNHLKRNWKKYAIGAGAALAAGGGIAALNNKNIGPATAMLNVNTTSNTKNDTETKPTKSSLAGNKPSVISPPKIIKQGPGYPGSVEEKTKKDVVDASKKGITVPELYKQRIQKNKEKIIKNNMPVAKVNTGKTIQANSKYTDNLDLSGVNKWANVYNKTPQTKVAKKESSPWVAG